MVELRNPNKGQVNISDDVIAAIAIAATKEVKGASMGVDGNLSEKITDFDIQQFLGTKKTTRHNRWVKVDSSGKLEVTVNIEILAGHKVLEISKNVQEKVQNEIETMTGLQVFTVNVNVIGLIA